MRKYRSMFVSVILLFLILLLLAHLYEVIVVGNMVPSNYYLHQITEREIEVVEVQAHLSAIREYIDFAEVYEYGYFDCSEMSAYLEWYFENIGVNAIICSTDEHSWVRIDQLYSPDINIESTGLFVASGNFWYQETTQYNSIYSITLKNDFDWWNTKYAEVLSELPIKITL